VRFERLAIMNWIGLHLK